MDYTPSSRRLSEISHLFLTDVRSKQTGGEARPARTPPGGFRRDVSVDMTPEEFAQVIQPAAGVAPAAPSFKPLRLVIAHHLGEAMADRVRDLAVSIGGREPVGVVYAGDAGLRVCCVDSAETSCEGIDDASAEPLDADQLRETLVELDQDVCQWLLVLPDPRSTDAQAMMKSTANWTLLSSADHDGIVAAYRALKGACGDATPRLSVSVFGVTEVDEVEKTHRKLGGVCEQFLKVGLTAGPVITNDAGAREVCVLDAATDESTASHWPILAGLIDGAGQPAAPENLPTEPETDMPKPVLPQPVVRAIPTPAPAPAMRMTPAADSSTDEAADTILELPDADASPAAIVKAVLGSGSGFTASPVKAPALPDATVAVSGDGRLTLLAVARPGLADLRSVATAFRWMTENLALIAMAAPQLPIRTDSDARLHLLVDAADADAAAVHPLLAATGVTVAPYRKLRWAGRTGLLMNAA